MNIKYHGHSFVEIITNKNIIFIDPFIEGNTSCDIKTQDAKCDYIILTHGHDDHFGSTVEIADANGATVIASTELSDYLYSKKIKTHAMSTGGSFTFPFGRVKMTIAHHSSSITDGLYAGSPAGVIINSEGKTIYHAGDTGLFYDMKLIGEMQKINVALLPIGDNYTMGVDDAVKAAEFLNADTIIPIHYNTFEEIKADPVDFKRKIESIGKKCNIMKAGEEISL